jgi:chaperonin GroEL
MIEFGIEARNKIKQGIDALANAVKVTLGPGGRNVIIQQFPIPPHLTKDGVTVARAVNLSDPIENIGAQLVKEIAGKTCNDAGDGSTTSVVLAQAIYNEGLKHVSTGVNVSLLRAGIERTVKKVVDYLDEIKITINQTDEAALKNIALVSSNQDEELSQILSQAFVKLGSDGIITIEDSRTSETHIDITEGLKLDKGFVNSYFGNNEKEECVLENCKILIVDGKIDTEQEIIPVLDACAKAKYSLLIICDSIEPKPLSIVLNNTLRQNIKACVVYSPGFTGESRKHKLKDLMSVVGGALWKPGEMFDLGAADKAIIDGEKTIIIGGKGDPAAFLERITTLKTFIHENTDSLPEGTILKLKERLAALINGIAILYVGAQSEIELKEKKDRADDTIRALQSALQEGIIAGGGTEYVKAAKMLSATIDDYSNEELLGREIVIKALYAPITQICLNADRNPGGAIYEIEKNCDRPGFGYNVLTNKIEHLINAGIIDPKKVARVALENSMSIVGSLLTTECVVIKEEKVPLIN